MISSEETVKSVCGWDYLESSPGKPAVPAMIKADGTKKFAEDPFFPETEALEFLSSKFIDLSILIMPPCSIATINAIAEKALDLKDLFVVDSNAVRLDIWKSFSAEINPALKVHIVQLPPDPVAAESLIKKELRDCSVDLFLGQSSLYVPTRFRRLDPETASLITNSVLNVQKEVCSMAVHRTVISWKDSINELMNCRSNAEVWEAPSLVPENTDIVVTGAGPSLDENVKDLKKNSGKSLIIATDGSLQTLIDNNLIPDFVVSMEGRSASWRLMSNCLTALSSVPLVLPLSSNHVVPRHYPGKIIFAKKTGVHSRWQQELEAGLPEYAGGLCVGHLACHFAESLKPRRIILAGFDLAFTGGKYHSEKMQTKYFNDPVHRGVGIEVESCSGTLVASSDSLNFYRKYFEEWAPSCKAELINASGPHGARIHGVKNGILDSLLVENALLQKLSLCPNRAFSLKDRRALLAELEKGIAAIRKTLLEIKAAIPVISPDRIVNPLKELPLDSSAFSLLCSCSNNLLMNAFSAVLRTYKPEKFQKYIEYLSMLTDDFICGTDLLLSFFSISSGGRKFSDNALMLIPQDFSHEAVIPDSLKDAVSVSADSPLPEIWNAIDAHDISWLIAFNGEVIPDSWTVPEIRCMDIKTEFQPKQMEYSLWMPEYKIACCASDIYSKWKAFVSRDVDCRLLEDNFRLWWNQPQATS